MLSNLENSLSIDAKDILSFRSLEVCSQMKIYTFSDQVCINLLCLCKFFSFVQSPFSRFIKSNKEILKDKINCTMNILADIL